MPPKSNVPIRIGGSKVRTGCKTCKRRHLKCDERRPICLRCQKVKLECSYDSSRSPSPESPNALSEYGGRSTTEIVAVKDFITRLGPELAGCFSDQVWCSILPRIAQQEAVIWDSVVAVSMLSESKRSGQSSGLAIRHYDKAIQALRLRLTSPGESRRNYQDMVLLCCLLFTIFECLQNSMLNALQHMIAGMNLLRQWEPDQAEDKQEPYLSRSALEPIFLNLDSQAIQLNPVGFRDYGSSPAINQPPRPQYTSFQSIQEAHLALNQIFNRLSHWSHWMEPTIAVGPKPDSNWLTLEKQLIGIQLAEWDKAFGPHLDLSNTAALLPLCQRTVAELFYRRSSDGVSEMGWDKYLPGFKQALQYAEMYMQPSEPTASTTEGGPERKQAVLTTSMDIVLPLFLISSRCRDVQTRRRALALLKACDRREGLWDAHQTYLASKRIIELEEQGTLEDGSIPDNARVSGIDVRLDSDSVVALVYRRRTLEGDDSESVIMAEDSLS